MKHYDAHKTNMKCEVFMDYEDEGKLLRDIANWWRYQKQDTKSIDFIRINYDGEKGIDAEVHWNY